MNVFGRSEPNGYEITCAAVSVPDCFLRIQDFVPLEVLVDLHNRRVDVDRENSGSFGRGCG